MKVFQYSDPGPAITSEVEIPDLPFHSYEPDGTMYRVELRHNSKSGQPILHIQYAKYLRGYSQLWDEKIFGYKQNESEEFAFADYQLKRLFRSLPCEETQWQEHLAKILTNILGFKI